MTQLTPVQRQVNLERIAKQEAEQRVHDRDAAAKEKRYDSNTPWGRAFMRQGDPIGALATAIEEKLSRIAQGQPSEYAQQVSYVKTMDPKVLAMITVKMGLDWCRVAYPDNKVQTFCQGLGERIYDELMLSEFHKQHPKEAGWKEREQKKKRKGYSYAVADYRKAMRKVGHAYPEWPEGTKAKVGTWLLGHLIATTDWIQTRDVYNRGKTFKVIEPTPAFREKRDELCERVLELSWCQWPMLCHPVGWTDERRGGYLAAEIRSRNSLVRGKVGSGPPLRGKLTSTPALRMLNKLQQTPYRVNRLVYEVAKECKEAGLTIGKFRQGVAIEPPPRPVHYDSLPEEEQKEWRRECTRIHDYNQTLFRHNYLTTELLHVASKFVEEKEFWIPWSFDYRGRCYPQATALQPQGSDFEKSLLLFAEPGPINEYWLAFHVATTYGLDKATKEERQQWVKDNVSLIQSIANDPMDFIHEWSAASEPWCFLAACVEYNDCVIEKSRTVSSLPVGIDATCSGLQHLSALTLDRGAAELVNVVPTPQPADAYKTVAEKAKEYLPESYHHLITRKVTKRTVMTTPYGVTLSSARSYIRQELPKELPDGSSVDLALVSKAIFAKAIPEVIPGPIKAMGFIRRAVVERIKAGSDFVSWVTPSGFPVVQNLRKSETEVIKTTLMGTRVKFNLAIDDPNAPPDLNHHRGASAPNLVHSLDAALLHLTFEDSKVPFTLIHDCIMARSCDMDQVDLQIREAFTSLYSKPVLQDWAQQIGAEFDESVMINTLDIQEAKDSPFLFC